MATISMGMTSTPLTATKNWTGTDQDMQDILNWAKVAFNPYIQATFNSSGNPAFVPTNQQIGLAIAQSWMNGIKDAVKKFKTDEAISAIPPVTPPSWA